MRRAFRVGASAVFDLLMEGVGRLDMLSARDSGEWCYVRGKQVSSHVSTVIFAGEYGEYSVDQKYKRDRV